MSENLNPRNPCNVILYGGTGQAKVVRPIVEYYGSKVVAVFDDTVGLHPPFDDIPLYCGFQSLLQWVQNVEPTEIGFVISIGNPHGNARLKLSRKLIELGFFPFDVIDPSAIVSANCSIGHGVQIMAGSVIMPEARIGMQCIINTKASVDHECDIADGCEIGPGATLCGCVKMERNAWVCAGATVLPSVIIGKNSIVGAGSVLRKHVPDKIVVAGVPAKKIRDL